MTEYQELRELGMSDDAIETWRNTGATHGAIKAMYKRLCDSSRDIPATVYHVCGGGANGARVGLGWDGGDLRPSGDVREFCRRWPDADGLEHVHAHVVHLHPTLDRALEHAEYFGGEILEVATEELDLVWDDYELPGHWTVRGVVPARAVRVPARMEAPRG